MPRLPAAVAVAVVGALVLAGCFATAESHVRAAESAMARGELGRASRELDAASRQAARDPRASAPTVTPAARWRRR